MTSTIATAALLGTKRLLLVKSTASADADLLKATIAKTIVVPAYTRKDGVHVPAHTKVVHYDPSKDHGDVLSGKGSHSQKLAHKKLAKLGHWESLPESDKLAHILSSATNIQQKASASAALSGWKAAMAAGKTPSGSQQAAFLALPIDKQAELTASVGKPSAAPASVYHLVGDLGLNNEGPLFKLHGGDYDKIEGLLGLPAGALAHDDSTTYTVKNAAGQTFSVYKHGGALSVRTSGGNNDHASAGELVSYLEENTTGLADALKDPVAAKLHAGMNKPGSWYSNMTGNGKAKWLAENSGAAASALAADKGEPVAPGISLSTPVPEKQKKVLDAWAAAGEKFALETMIDNNKVSNPHIAAYAEKLLAGLPKIGAAIHTFANEKEGIAASVIYAGSSKYNVILKDTDAGEFLPSAKQFGNEADAVAHAKKLAGIKNLEGKSAYEHMANSGTSVKNPLVPSAKEWLAANPGKEDELSSALVDLGMLSVAQLLGIYKPPGFGAGQSHGPDAGAVLDYQSKKDAQGTATVKYNGEDWYVQSTGVDSPDGSLVFAHLASKTEGTVQKNGFVPKQVADWVPKSAISRPVSSKTASKPDSAIAVGDVFSFSGQYEKMNTGQWVVYNTIGSLDAGSLGGTVHLHKVGAKVPNVTNSAVIPGKTLLEAIAAGTAKKVASESGPKEGDTKPGADGGTLVLKDGHWVKQDGDKSKLAMIPWDKQLLPAENSNAKSHNGQIAKIKAMADAGDVAGLQAYVDGKAGAKQTYAKKQHLLAATALAALKDGGTAAAPAAPASAPAPAVSAPAPVVKVSNSVKKIQAMDPAAVAEWLASKPGKMSPFAMSFFDHATKAGRDKFIKWVKASRSLGMPDHWKASYQSAAVSSLFGQHDKTLIDGVGFVPTKSVTVGQAQKVVTDPAAIHKAAIAAASGQPIPASNAKPAKPRIAQSAHWDSVAEEISQAIDANDVATLNKKYENTMGMQSPNAIAIHNYAKAALAYLSGTSKPKAPPEVSPLQEEAMVNAILINGGTMPGAGTGVGYYAALFDSLTPGQQEYLLEKGKPKSKVQDPTPADLVPLMEAINSAGPTSVAKKAAIRYLEAFPNSQLAVNQVHDALHNAGYIGLATAFAKDGKPGLESASTASSEPLVVHAPVLHNTQDGHSKFWSVSVNGKELTTVYGKIGTKGQSSVKKFDSVTDAMLAAEGAIKSKIKGGYHNTGKTMPHEYPAAAQSASPATAPTPAPAAGPIKPQFGPDSHSGFSIAADAFEQMIKVKDIDQLKNSYWQISTNIDKDTKAIASYAKQGLISLGVNPAYFAYHLDKYPVPASFDKKKAALIAAAQAGDINAIKEMKVGTNFYMKKAKSAYLSALESSADAGPKEGDTKQGADGMLVLKNGHWVKMTGEDSAAWKFTKKDLAFTGVSTLTSSIDGVTVYVAHDKESGIFSVGTIDSEGDPGEVNYYGGAADVLAKLKSKFGANADLPSLEQIKSVMTGEAATDFGQPKPASATPAPVSASGYEAMDNWKQTGPQGGSNPGGRFRDEHGTEWYCKFPADEDIAKSEVLAAKLYAALGISGQDCKLITKGGKVGIASRWIAVNKVSANELASLDGTASGFGADAWLGNWDVVGLGYDNLQVGPDGKAHRVDAGGSLMYRAQGGKKQFGSTVIEVDSLRDSSLNPQAAKVFGKMTPADISASVAKVLALPDQSIVSLVNQYGPGDEASKQALASTLIARKADLAAKFPKAAKQPKKVLDPSNLPVKPSDLPKPHDFENWNGQGKGLSSKAHVNKANTDVEYQILTSAQAGNLPELKAFHYTALDKETGLAGAALPIANHPSKHVVQYHSDLVQILEEIANPPEPLKIFQETDVSTLDQLVASLPPKKFGTTVDSVQSNEKLGFWVVLGVAPSALKFKPAHTFNFSGDAIDAGYVKFKQGSALAKHFIKSVQASGSYNDLFRSGKSTDHSGNKLSDVAKAALAHATSQPEGTSIYRWQKMTDAMVSKVMAAQDGTVFQATGPMCTSYSPTATQHFGKHRVTIRYAKGAKAVDSFGSDGYKSEKEVTTLPNSRFVILKKEMVPDTNNGGQRLELELLMLPPDLGL
jgi:predicted DNA-binding WGR domain protein